MIPERATELVERHVGVVLLDAPQPCHVLGLTRHDPEDALRLVLPANVLRVVRGVV